VKIVISTEQDMVAQHFGRCPQFTIVDITDSKINDQQVIDNPGHSPGFLPQFFAEKNVECIIAGGMGFRAQNAFTQYSIETIVGVTGKIVDVIAQILDGTLKGGESLCDRISGKHHECEHHDH
jgi:predicted Fe-Mo cluster-binding NifX family protein